MRGGVLINGFSGIGLHQAERLREEFFKLDCDVPIIENRLGEVSHELDFCVFLDKDIYLAKSLEARGVRLYNTSRAIELCDDKMLTYLALDGVAHQPLSISASLCYSDNAPVNRSELDYIIGTLGLPLIVKLNRNSRGEGVFLAETEEELKGYISRFRREAHLYQKYISFARGRDTRVIVIGGTPVCAMERYNPRDYRSNVELGGAGTSVQISNDIYKTAVKVSKALGLDYCGIDFLTDEQGANYVCEVNSNAFFKGIEAVSGVNVAALYAKYISDSLK